MSSWCVEYWKVPKKTEGSHAQMREQLKWVKPEHKGKSWEKVDDVTWDKVVQRMKDKEKKRRENAK